jgi:hypothetical protein
MVLRVNNPYMADFIPPAFEVFEFDDGPATSAETPHAGSAIGTA